MKIFELKFFYLEFENVCPHYRSFRTIRRLILFKSPGYREKRG